jgi:N4-gp56 family major capsid protein
VFTLNLIDQAVELAKVGNNMVRPIRIGGQPKYVCYLHPYQVTSMRTNASSGQWMDIQKAAMMGGKVTDNPIYTGALGEYNGVILRSSQDVATGVSESTSLALTSVHRAVLLGAQAAMIAYGQQNNPGQGKYRWNEELFDHKRKLEVSSWAIWGLKKSRFNSADFGTVTIHTYAAASS